MKPAVTSSDTGTRREQLARACGHQRGVSARSSSLDAVLGVVAAAQLVVEHALALAAVLDRARPARCSSTRACRGRCRAEARRAGRGRGSPRRGRRCRRSRPAGCRRRDRSATSGEAGAGRARCRRRARARHAARGARVGGRPQGLGAVRAGARRRLARAHGQPRRRRAPSCRPPPRPPRGRRRLLRAERHGLALGRGRRASSSATASRTAPVVTPASVAASPSVSESGSAPSSSATRNRTTVMLSLPPCGVGRVDQAAGRVVERRAPCAGSRRAASSETMPERPSEQSR